MTPGSFATPLPTNFDADPSFMMTKRVIGVCCSPEIQGRLGEGTIKTFFVSSVMDMIMRMRVERNPLVLLHAGSLEQADIEMASVIRDLPSNPVVALMAGEGDWDTAFGIARQLGLGAIFPEESLRFPRQLHLWADWSELGGPPPGLAVHLDPGTPITECRIRQQQDKPEFINSVLELARTVRGDASLDFHLQLILEEIVNNSILHAFHTEQNEEKYRIDTFTNLDEDEEIEAAFGADSKTIAVCVGDNQGCLRRETILTKIERQLNKHGVLDQNGRGLYLAYSLAGRAIFILRPKKLTQTIVLFPASETAWLESPPLRPLLVF